MSTPTSQPVYVTHGPVQLTRPQLIGTLTGLLLLGAAVFRELSLPSTERTWHGTLFGRVPYDLRPPTIQRLVSSVWRPSDPRVLVPTAFGVGWTINLAFPLRETVVS